MKTIVVWVLYISAAGGYGGTSPAIAVIDNIDSQRNCVTLSRQVAEGTFADHLRLRCIAVRKVVP